VSASLRDFIAGLEQVGELLDLDEPLSTDFELAGALSLLEAGPALRCTPSGPFSMRVVGNVVNSRARIARALRVPQERVSDALLRAIAEPLPPRRIELGPCQEVIRDPDLATLPIPRFFSKETGRYITAGVILVRDVITGQGNMSFARLKVLGPTTAMLGVSPNHHLGKMAARAAVAGRDLPIAVAVGTHPGVMLAACLYLAFGDDELQCAGRLLGAPVDVVRAIDSEIDVPADSELILEGVVKAGQSVEEGLVSEFHGRYHDYGQGYVVEFTRITHRHDALFQVIIPGLHQEHILLGAVPIAAGLKAQLQRRVPGVVDVAVPDTGAGRTTAVVSISHPGPGQAHQAMMACFSAVSLIKQVVVVDADIDVWSHEAVEWARVFHTRPERDLLIIEGARSDRSDPLARELTLGKLGVDATRKPGERAEGWAFARVPDDAMDRASQVLSAAQVNAARSPLLRGIACTEDGHDG